MEGALGRIFIPCSACKRVLEPCCVDKAQRGSRCGGCHIARYCDVNCQRAHWKDHKPICDSQNPHSQLINNTQLNSLKRKAWNIAIRTGCKPYVELENSTQSKYVLVVPNLCVPEQVIVAPLTFVMDHFGKEWNPTKELLAKIKQHNAEHVIGSDLHVMIVDAKLRFVNTVRVGIGDVGEDINSIADRMMNRKSKR